MGEGDRVEILVVEDEAPVRRGLCDLLVFHGYAPTAVGDGVEGLREGLTGRYGLVLLDVMLPLLDGYSVCTRLRAAWPRLPIVMLTARGAEEDVLRGFAAGSDDYVVKPFSVAQVMARVRAILRRAAPDPPADQSFAFGPWTIDPARLAAQRDGRSVELTRREVALCALFAREQGRIVGRRALLREVWGYENAERVETRTVDVHLGKLRKKLAPDGHLLIATVHGEGYRLHA